MSQIVKILIDHPEYNLDIDAHTNEEAAEGSNLSLSRARAKRIKDYLISKGIEKERLKAEGFGSIIPVYGNETRIEFKITF